MLSAGAARLVARLFLLWAFIFCIPFSFAHLAGGFDKEVNGYLIDVGHDPNPLVAGDSSSFSIGLMNASTQEPVDIDKIWVRLSTDEGVVYAGTHFAQNGIAPISLVLPRGGEYTLSVRFYLGDGPKAIASADFPIAVSSDDDSSKSSGNSRAVFFFFLGLVVVGIVGYILGKGAKTKRKNKKLK